MVFDTRLLTGVGVMAAVTEAGNLSRAAEILNLTPSGVSRAVARLEARVGVRLFDRTPRSVSLTEEGRRFHAQVMPLLASLADAVSEVAGTAEIVRGRLRVSVDPWFARMVLAPRLGQFLVRYPLLTLDFSTSNHREDMMAGFDVAVRFGPPDMSSLIARQLSATRVVTVASPAYLDRHGTPGSPHDLVHHEAILFRDPQTGLPFPWEFRRDGKTVECSVPGRVVMNDPSAAVSACMAGLGLFQSLAIGLETFIERGDLVPVLRDWSDECFPLYAYHPSRHLPPAKVRAFLDFVQVIAASSDRASATEMGHQIATQS